MKTFAFGLFIVVLSMVMSQPWIEMYNMVKDKITLDAAILSACRVAARHALDEDYYNTDVNFGDLNANVDEDEFKYYFADAFEKTLNVDRSASSSGEITFTPRDRHWKDIKIMLDFHYNDGAFTGRKVTKVIIKLETKYSFRTPLMSSIATSLAHVSELEFIMGINRPYVIQIIN